MIEFVLEQMINQRLTVFFEFTYECGQREIAVLYLTNRVIVALCEDFDSVRKLSLSSNILFFIE